MSFTGYSMKGTLFSAIALNCDLIGMTLIDYPRGAKI